MTETLTTSLCGENCGIVPYDMLQEVSVYLYKTPGPAIHELISGLVLSHIRKLSIHCETPEIADDLADDFASLEQAGLSFEILSASSIPERFAEHGVFIASDMDSLQRTDREAWSRQVELQYKGGEISAFQDLIRFCKSQGIPFRFGCTDEFISAKPEVWSVLSDEGFSLTGPNACTKYCDSCHIESDGTVYPCRCCKLAMGNIFEKSLKEILEFSNIFDYYHNIGCKQRKVKEPCCSCTFVGACAGCRGRAWRFSGDFLAPDPGCEMVDRDKIEILPFHDPEKCLPHRPPMLLAGTLLKIEDYKNYAEYTIPEESIFLQGNGALHPAALIEIAAQSMGFLDTFLHRGTELSGGLVEVEKFSCSGLPLFPGDKLYIENEKIFKMPPWHIAGFRIFKIGVNNQLVAEGEFKLCHFDTM